MSLITISYVFASGNTIIAAQHNLNNSVIYNDYNGNITNDNVASNAAIVYSKLVLTSNIVNADINASAAISNSKLNLATIAQDTTLNGKVLIGSANQGDIFYDNGTQITRLTHGTSGQFLQTQGASANPQWATVSTSGFSNVLFQYSAITSNQITLGTGVGEIIGSDLIPTTGGTYRFIESKSTTASYSQIYTTKFIKIPGISTVTVFAEIWRAGGGGTSANLKVDIGGANSNVSGTANRNTPEWVSMTIDVSGLSNGTTYAVTISEKVTSSSDSVYMGNLIAFGS